MLYACLSHEKLVKKTLNRNLSSEGSREVLVERLEENDKENGSYATTITTSPVRYNSNALNISTVAYGRQENPEMLIGERITHWCMNTWYPTLELYFESGRAVTLEGSQIRNAKVDMDPNLRDFLTLLTHREDGSTLDGIDPTEPLEIVNACTAHRKSKAIKPLVRKLGRGNARPSEIWIEEHIVTGLRLEGMHTMGYVYSVDSKNNDVGGCWGVTVRDFRKHKPLS